MLKELLQPKPKDDAAQIAEIEARLADDRAALDTAWREYGGASFDALAAGAEPGNSKASTAVEAASKRVQATEAALDHARTRKAERDAAAKQEAEQAAKETLRTALDELGAAGHGVDDALSTLAEGVQRYAKAEAAVRAAAGDTSHVTDAEGRSVPTRASAIAHTLSDASQRFRFSVALACKGMPGLPHVPYSYTVETARWSQYLPTASLIE